MPDDLAEVEKRIMQRMEKHFRRMEEDPEYRKRWDEMKPNEQRPILPIGAW